MLPGNVTHSLWRLTGTGSINGRNLLKALYLDLTRTLGAAVRHHRELMRLSQEDLAERAGLDRTYISGVERGRRNPTVQVLQCLAQALGIDLDVLFATARELAVKPPENR